MTGADLYRAGEGTHRGYLEAMGRPAKVSPYHRYVIYLERRMFLLDHIRHIVAISAGGKVEIERLYGTPPERVSLVYNGVDLARFDPATLAPQRDPARAELGLAPGTWCVLFVGSGFERKGLGPLIEGLALHADRSARLVVAGKGDPAPYQALAARLGVGERLTWTGPRADVERLYAAADLVALPARYEPFGNVHLEALASGRPVLSSARAGGAELIAGGVNGWVAREVSGPAIAEALERLRAADAVALGRARAGIGRALYPCRPGGGLRDPVPAAARLIRPEPSIFIDPSGWRHYTVSRWRGAPPSFIDRDGCLTEEVGYVNHASRLRLLPRTAEAVRAAERGRHAGSDGDQSGGHRARLLLRGRAARDQRGRGASARRGTGARLDALYVCTHHPTEGAPPYRAELRLPQAATGAPAARRARAQPSTSAPR